ncbi:MAG: monooxygenase [Arthrobacter sp.]|nr:monooxygenase [Arthrobacter sp.]
MLHGDVGQRPYARAGTPEQVADAIQEWFQAGAAGGFNIMPPVLLSGLDTFVDHVIPILRDRGLFRREYTGRTLREHYGLPRPGNAFVPATRSSRVDKIAPQRGALLVSER